MWAPFVAAPSALAAPVRAGVTVPLVPAPTGPPLVAEGPDGTLVLGARNLCGATVRGAEVTRVCAGSVELQDRPDARVAGCGQGFVLVGNTTRFSALWLDREGRQTGGLVDLGERARALAVDCVGGEARVAWVTGAGVHLATLTTGAVATSPIVLPVGLGGRAERVEVSATDDGAVVAWEERTADGARAIVAARVGADGTKGPHVVSADGFDERAPVLGRDHDGLRVAWTHGDLAAEARVVTLDADAAPVAAPRTLLQARPAAMLPAEGGGVAIWARLDDGSSDGASWVEVAPGGEPRRHALGPSAWPFRHAGATWIAHADPGGFELAPLAGGAALDVTGRFPVETARAVGDGGPDALLVWTVGRGSPGEAGGSFVTDVAGGTTHRLGEHRFGVDLAWGGGTWLTVWDDAGVVALPLAADGRPATAEPIFVARQEFPAGSPPAVAFDGEHFVVVWVAKLPHDSREHVVGARVDGVGRRVGTGFLVAEGASAPAVACVPSGCAVVYVRSLDAGRGVTVPDGVGATWVLRGVPGEAVTVVPASDVPQGPLVAGGPDGLVVGWTQEEGEVAWRTLDAGGGPGPVRSGPAGTLQALAAAAGGPWATVDLSQEGGVRSVQLVRWVEGRSRLVGAPVEALDSKLGLAGGQVVVAWSAYDRRTGVSTVVWDEHRP